MGGVALDGLDEVGDEVDAALELDVDLRPRVLDLVAPADQAVVRGDEVDRHEHHDGDHDDEPNHGGSVSEPSREVRPPLDKRPSREVRPPFGIDSPVRPDAGLGVATAPATVRSREGGRALRIGLISPYSLSVPGGVQAQVLGLARELRRQGHEARVLGPCDGPPPESFVTPLGNSLPTAANGSVAPLAPDASAALRTIRALRDEQFDVIHIHEPLAPARR